MSVTAPEWIFDISDGGLTGLLKATTSKIKLPAPRFTRNQIARRRIRLVVPNETSGLWTTQDLTGATIIVAIGEPDAAPTSGTFTLTYGANTTSALDYDVSASAMQTALNLLASIIAAGGVTVTKETGAFYTITFTSVGARTQITGSASSLHPLCSVVGDTATEGDASTAEIQTIALVQQYLAYSDSWVGGASVATGTLEFNTLALRQKFANETGDEIEETMEIKVAFPGEDLDVVYHATVSLNRDLITQTGISALTVAGPLTPTTGIAFDASITGYTGGGATKLDGLATVGLSVNRVLAFIEATDGLRLYALVAGTDAESSPAVIRPDDYNASTNAKVWKSAL